MFITILEALIALPKIGSQILEFIGLATKWYIERQSKETQAAIMDAMSTSLSAETDEDRINALTKWQLALSRDRIE